MAPTLRSASSLGTDLAGPSTPAKKREARSQAQCRLLELPCELLERSALAGQDYKTLCALASTCAHLRTLSEVGASSAACAWMFQLHGRPHVPRRAVTARGLARSHFAGRLRAPT